MGLETKVQDFLTTRAAYTNGGSAQKGPYNAAKDALMAELDVLAEYVNTVADGNEDTILLSGFKPTKGTASKPPKPVEITGVTVKRGAAGQLLADCDNQDFVTSYVCIVTVGAPPPPEYVISDSGQLYIVGQEPVPPTPTGAIFDFNKNHKKTFSGLVSGTRYYFTYFGINSEGVGPLSAPVSSICG